MSHDDIDQYKSDWHNKIKKNIQEYGFHITQVRGGPLPDYFYSIGLSATLGFEFAAAGASYYTGSEIAEIFHRLRSLLIQQQLQVNHEYDLKLDGVFTLRNIHDSWTHEVGRGAIRWYPNQKVRLLQVVPDPVHVTIDNPDLNSTFDVNREKPWKWLKLDWTGQIDRRARANVDFGILRGRPAKEIIRWHHDSFTVVSGSFDATLDSDCRSVPLATLWALDSTIDRAAFELDDDSGAFRRSYNEPWEAITEPAKKRNGDAPS